MSDENGDLDTELRLITMLSKETLEQYRQMTTGERLTLTLKMIRENTPYLFVGTPEQVDRKFELLRRENDERNRRILEALAHMRDKK